MSSHEYTAIRRDAEGAPFVGNPNNQAPMRQQSTTGRFSARTVVLSAAVTAFAMFAITSRQPISYLQISQDDLPNVLSKPVAQARLLFGFPAEQNDDNGEELIAEEVDIMPVDNEEDIGEADIGLDNEEDSSFETALLDDDDITHQFKGPDGKKYFRPAPFKHCPNICRLNLQRAHLDCSRTRPIFRNCVMRLCEHKRGKGGYICKGKGKTPSRGKCPRIFRRSAAKAYYDCKNKAGKRMRHCMVKVTFKKGPRGRRIRGFKCAPRRKRGPSGGASKVCPGRIRRHQKFALRDCTFRGKRKPNCKLVRIKRGRHVFYKCVSKGGSGTTAKPTPTPTPTPTPEPTPEPTPTPTFSPGEGDFAITIDGVTLGEELTYPLKFTNSDSGTPKEDFYLLVDATGSMAKAINNAKSKFRDIIAKRREASSDVAFGVGYYRDEMDAGNGFVNVQSMTLEDAKIQSAINGITAAGGRDLNEANLVALYKVATEKSIGWREGARRILVYFGDISGHEPSCVGGLRLDRKMVSDTLNEYDITVVAASFSPGLDRPTTQYGCGGSGTGTGQASAITSGTDGALVSSADQSKLVELIDNAVSTLPLTYTVDASDCGGKLTSTYSPDFPFQLMPGASKELTQTIVLTEEACETGEFSCDIKYTASGGSLGTAKVRVSNIEGC